MATTKTGRIGEYDVEVGAWSGNVRPWLARVSLNGRYVGETGFCKTADRAFEAASQVVARHRARSAEVSR